MIKEQLELNVLPVSEMEALRDDDVLFRIQAKGVLSETKIEKLMKFLENLTCKKNDKVPKMSV